MSMIVTVKDDLTKKKKSCSKSSDESGFSSEELQYTKKKKSRAICEEDLSKEERTRSEINEAATYEVLPSYPTFDAKSSVSVNKNNLTAQTQLTSYSSNNTNVLLASPNTLPSIGEFFSSLDQKHNCNVYSNFKNAFLEEEIAVNVIKDLSDDQLQKLEVVKIGWQKNIKRAAQRF
ncbi:unnamed protein product [Rhizophagus irregularis]|nr:unnamed protein product [Rhizophagus irregularis]